MEIVAVVSPDDDDAGGSLLGTDVPVEDVRSCLDRAEFGVLGLAEGSDAYTVPLSFGHAPDLSALYFLLGFAPDSRKRELLDATETASFVVAEAALPDEWQSIMFTGSVAPVGDDEQQAAYSALADSAAFPATHTFEDYYELAEMEQDLFKFDVDSVTARRGGAPDR